MQNENILEGRHAVLEAFRAGETIDKLYILDGCHDGPLENIRREAKKQNTMIRFVTRERLDQLSETGKHQGVVAQTASFAYAEIDDIFALAKKRGEEPFVFLLDEIEDPHNLGAIIRSANVCGAHGVIIPKNRAALLTAAVARASAGAISYTPGVKERGLWLVCADMEGEPMYRLKLTGPIGLVIGNEGSGVSTLVKKHCDMMAAIPMKGEISSLNASVAAGVLAYEIVRQRLAL